MPDLGAKRVALDQVVRDFLAGRDRSASLDDCPSPDESEERALLVEAIDRMFATLRDREFPGGDACGELARLNALVLDLAWLAPERVLGKCDHATVAVVVERAIADVGRQLSRDVLCDPGPLAELIHWLCAAGSETWR